MKKKVNNSSNLPQEKKSTYPKRWFKCEVSHIDDSDCGHGIIRWKDGTHECPVCAYITKNINEDGVIIVKKNQ